MTAKTTIQNCYIVTRENKPAFYADKNGNWHIDLDGYAIVPLEQYGQHTRRVKKLAKKLAESKP